MTASIEEAQGTVVALGRGRATVRVQSGVACPRCAAGRGCGAMYQFAERNRLVEVPVPSASSLSIGQRVTLSLEPARLLQAAWLAYGIPLLAVLGATLAAASLLPAPVSDAAALAAATTGLAAACWWSRRRMRSAACPGRFAPSLRASAVRSPQSETG